VWEDHFGVNKGEKRTCTTKNINRYFFLKSGMIKKGIRKAQWRKPWIKSTKKKLKKGGNGQTSQWKVKGRLRGEQNKGLQTWSKGHGGKSKQSGGIGEQPDE